MLQHIEVVMGVDDIMNGELDIDALCKIPPWIIELEKMIEEARRS